MKTLFLTLSLFWAVNSHAQTTTPATQKRLDELRQSYESAVTRQAGTAYTAATKALDAKYITALERMIATSTQGGKLDDAIALRDEKKRVTDALPLPDSDAEVPESLKSMRSTYREQLAGIAAVRDKSVEPLKKRYIEELQKLEAERTKAGSLDDALAIRSVREELNPTVASGSPALSKDEKPAIAKGSGKTDHKAAEQIITWALANNATVKTDQGLVGANEKLKTMPKGRFSVIEINAENTVPSFPWELLLGLSEVTKLRINVTEPVTSAQTKNIAGLPVLGDLLLMGPLSVEALRALPMNNRLHELQIRPATGSEDITSAIAFLAVRCPSVTQLGWSSTDDTTTAETCSELAKWPRVHGLTTRGDLSAACLDALAKMPALDWLLCLGSGTIDPASLPKLKGLKYLNSFFGRHQPGLVEAASQLPLLDALQITMQNRTVADLEPLTKMKRLNRLGLRMGGAAAPSDDYAPLLASLKGITWLSMTDSNLTDAGLKHLEGLKALETLDIKGSKVTDAGMAAFKKARPKCKVSR